MRVVGSRSSAEDPEALAARLAAQLAPEVAPTRSMAAVVVASPCSVATVTQHLVDELQLDAAVGFGSHREAFCEACDGANPRAAVTLLAMPDGATATAFASDAGCLPALEDWERFVQAPPSLLLFAAAGSPSERNKLDEWLQDEQIAELQIGSRLARHRQRWEAHCAAAEGRGLCAAE